MNPTDYVEQVISGKIVACKWVRLACERHRGDLKRKDLHFDDEAGMFYIEFVESLFVHSKGEFHGTPFLLEPWQKFIVWQLFGWKKKSGHRRFAYSYIAVPRKNGKTTLLAAIALLFFIADGEQGAEIYFAATKKDQARIGFNEAKHMVESSPELKQLVEVMRSNLSISKTYSKVEPLSSDQNSLDGLNVHFAGVDEYHAHKTPDIYNVLKSAMGARRQPHQMTITTAGFNKGGPCFELEKTCKKILEGSVKDDSMLAIVFTIDDEDDWKDPKVWAKANPSLGVTIRREYLKQEFQQALNLGGSQEVNFKTKHLNMWVDAEVTWIPDEVWMLCDHGVDDSVEGLPSWGGLDLATTRDITALVLVIPKPDGTFGTRRFFWLPEDTVKDRLENLNDNNYRRWVDDGFIRTTPGNVTDYGQILRDITGRHISDGRVAYDEDCIWTKYNIQSIAYDRYNSSQIIIDLTGEGLRCDKFGQGFLSMSSPTKQLERLVYGGLINHEGDPVLRWMMSNVSLRTDPADNIKVDKAKSSDKVDGVVALVMAVGQHLTEDGPDVITDEMVVI